MKIDAAFKKLESPAENDDGNLILYFTKQCQGNGSVGWANCL
jgi:hypothetical protein